MGDPKRDLVLLRHPRGRELFTPFKPMVRDFARRLAFIPVFLSGAYAVLMAQASSPDYQRLYWHALASWVIHLLLSVLYFRFTQSWLRWFGALLSLLSLLSLICLAELGLRVFAGFRLFG